MIIGIGTDIIDTRRIKKTITNFGNKFKKRCFLSSEIKRSEETINSVNSYAKRYAAKEACAKALGILHNRALSILKNLSKKNCNIEVSLSDEKNYAIANVIIFEI